MNKRILLTAFRGSSAEVLLKGAKGSSILLLPNDKVEDSRMLIPMISSGKFDYVFSIGQRPNIKNKIHIETTARSSDISIITGYDCQRLVNTFQQNGICARLSHNAGTSFCNQLYLKGLCYLAQSGLDTQMVFIHIPYLKNIDDLESFRKSFLNAVQEGV